MTYKYWSTYIPYTSTKTPKKMQSLNEDIASVIELFGHEIYIRLYIIEDTDVTDSSLTEYTTPLSFQQVIVRKLKTTLLLKLRLLKSLCTSHLENNNHHILIEGDAGTSRSNIIAFVCDEMSKSSFGIFTKILDCKSLKGK